MNRGNRLLAPERPVPVAAAAAVLGIAFAWGVVGPHAARAVAALATSWIFFAGAATGALAVSAVLELSGAEWAEPIQVVTARLARYFPVAAGILVVLAAFTPETRALHGRAALVFFAREAACGLALFAFGGIAARRRPDRGRPAWILVTYCLIFAGVLSLWAFDFVVIPTPGFSNTLAGPHFFVGAFVSGAALAVIGALRAGTLTASQRRDAATLVVALSILWAYLFWSQLLTLWYGNLPDEAAFLARRIVDGWSVVVLLVVAGTFVLPFVLLVSARGKASTRALYAAAAAQLFGLWLERQLLVVPAVAGRSATPFDLGGALIQIGMAGVFLFYTWPWVNRPAVPIGRAAVASRATGAAASHG